MNDIDEDLVRQQKESAIRYFASPEGRDALIGAIERAHEETERLRRASIIPREWLYQPTTL